jgi:hypothetical protein
MSESENPPAAGAQPPPPGSLPPAGAQPPGGHVPLPPPTSPDQGNTRPTAAPAQPTAPQVFPTTGQTEVPARKQKRSPGEGGDGPRWQVVTAVIGALGVVLAALIPVLHPADSAGTSTSVNLPAPARVSSSAAPTTSDTSGTSATSAPAGEAAPSACAAQESTSANATWYIPSAGCGSVIPSSHNCKIIATSADTSATSLTQGVECVSVYTKWTSPDSAQIWGEGQFYCQGENSQCLRMNVAIDLSVIDIDKGAAAVTVPLKNYSCAADCPAIGRAVVDTERVVVTPTSHCYQTFAWEPVGNVVGVNGADDTSPGTEGNNSGNVLVCFGHP